MGKTGEGEGLDFCFVCLNVEFGKRSTFFVVWDARTED